MLLAIHFSGSLYPVFGTKMYIALVALVLNLVVTLVVSGVLAAVQRPVTARRPVIG
jgi:uncharacterized protein (DUF2062 family)